MCRSYKNTMGLATKRPQEQYKIKCIRESDVIFSAKTVLDSEELKKAVTVFCIHKKPHCSGQCRPKVRGKSAFLGPGSPRL